MATIIINEKSKQAKAIIAMLKTFDFVEFISNADKNEKEDYSPEFVEKVKKAKQEIKEGKTIVMNPEDIWGSLGLK
jgi:hypothetical protein